VDCNDQGFVELNTEAFGKKVLWYQAGLNLFVATSGWRRAYYPVTVRRRHKRSISVQSQAVRVQSAFITEELAGSPDD
jgi:hypothetical protein